MEENKHFLSSINNEIRNNPEEYVSYCERSYTRTLKQIAREVVAKSGSKIVMLSGPSASGKTTSANKLARIISRMGYNAYVISLDDFYKNRDDVPIGPDGKQDFETVYALELSVLTKCLKSLATEGHAGIPHFDFVSGSRQDNVIDLKLHPGDVVVVEGLHALNPIITDCLDGENLIKMYVSIASDIYDQHGDIIFGRRDIRFFRRTIRDFNFRNSSVINTYGMWPKVLEGETKYLFPYMDRADYIIDSIHPYEVCIYKDKATRLLSEVSPENENFADAQRLLAKLDLIEGLDKAMIPKTSLLHEFVGK